MATIILRDSGSISSPGATAKGAPLTNLEVDNNFSNINLTVGVVGDLTTTAKSNLVIAVNELVTSNTATNARITTTNANLANTDSNVSSVSSSLTTTNTNLTTTNSNIGVLTNLTTTTKANVVNAINEVKGGNLSQFAATTSAQLASIISDETGTGSLVFAGSPTFTGTATANNITLSNVLTTKKIVETVVAIGNTGTAAIIDLSLGTLFTATLNGSATLNISNPGTVSSFVLVLTNDGTAGRTVAFTGGTFKAPNGTVSRTTSANATDVWFFFTPDSGTTWYYAIPMSNLS